jgi:addiction module HigA family antidote
LANVHPGDILREDFLIGSEIPFTEVAEKTGIAVAVLQDVVAGLADVTADLDLRLGTYFGMSKGFFLRLQNLYDLEEAERAAGPEIARIQPRVAHAA